MKYVIAERPEKHNGGVFFEHEIHFNVPGSPGWYNSHALKEHITEFITNSIGSKHTDFRISISVYWLRTDDKVNKSPVRVAVVRARFVDKNKALMFKLAFQPE